ncbi:MAG TPA: histidine ammonia-lyase [Puia sp.]|jgi:histidine ammonia-lyase|nr:histidine ammonia-lyase [Puia sp.]
MPKPFHYGSDKLTPAIVIALAGGEMHGIIPEDSMQRIIRSRDSVNEIVSSGKTVYGINTGFGILSNTNISAEDTRKLQHKILQSHSVGVGKPISPFLSRIMMITKVHSLAQGYSGIQPETLERICWFIDQDISPVVPEKGSVGASGDLAPLAHLFLPLIGLGEVWVKSKILPTEEVLSQNGLKPLQLGPKEGLALINGTQFILAYAVANLQRMHFCLESADLIGAMSLEALTGTKSPFDERIHNLRPFRGNQLVAQRLRKLLTGSEIMQSHVDCGRVQDPYSLRCMPQVHGASRNAWLHLKELILTELNSVTDNPLIFSADDTISGGNFHGQPLAIPLDYATIASSEAGNISDRRCYLLLEGKWGLPLLLMKDVGLNSGFMIPQYTTAALVTENKTLCFPASADSIPTSLGQEDHVSMGSISGRKLEMVLENLEYILAIELMTACQAIEFRRPLHSSSILEHAHEFVRQQVSFAREDRIFADDIRKIKSMIESYSFIRETDAFANAQGIELNKDYESFSLNN